MTTPVPTSAMRCIASRSVQVRPGIAHADQVRQRVDGMHAHQRSLRRIELAAHQRQVHVAMHMILVR